MENYNITKVCIIVGLVFCLLLEYRALQFKNILFQETCWRDVQQIDSIH